MEAKEYIEMMKLIHNNILMFLDQEENTEENYQKTKKLFDDFNIIKNNDDIKSILYLLSNLSSNHHRNRLFFNKIEKILQFFKGSLNAFSNSEIFNIFKNNKRILLFLIEEEILIMDENIINTISIGKYKAMDYIHFFDPEIKIYINNLANEFKNEEILAQYPKLYFEKRKEGENDNFLEKLIRNDSIVEFISYVEENHCLLNDKIAKSIFECNLFLLKNKEITIIEYAAFCGSLQIFKYLIDKQVCITNNIFLYAVHGNNPEIMQYLESNLNSDKDDISFEQCFKEAIKCHHNDLADYIQKKFLDQNEMEYRQLNNYKENILSYSFHYYNFAYFTSDPNNNFILHYVCQYDYFTLLNLLLKTKGFDIKKKIILHIEFIIF